MSLVLIEPNDPVTLLREWDPTARQEVEPDTLYLMNLDVEATLAPPAGGMIGGNEAYGTSADRPPWRGGVNTVTVVPGKYRDGIKSIGGTNAFVYLPLSGVLPSDQWTMEFFVKSDVAWSALSNALAFRVWADYLQEVHVNLNAGSMQVLYQHDQDPAGFVQKVANLVRATLANTWVSVALTLLEETLRIYTNGVLLGTLTGCTSPVSWDDWWAGGSGLTVSLETGDVTVSDVRISRLGRVPGEVPVL